MIMSQVFSIMLKNIVANNQIQFGYWAKLGDINLTYIWAKHAKGQCLMLNSIYNQPFNP